MKRTSPTILKLSYTLICLLISFYNSVSGAGADSEPLRLTKESQSNFTFEVAKAAAQLYQSEEIAPLFKDASGNNWVIVLAPGLQGTLAKNPTEAAGSSPLKVLHTAPILLTVDNTGPRGFFNFTLSPPDNEASKSMNPPRDPGTQGIESSRSSSAPQTLEPSEEQDERGLTLVAYKAHIPLNFLPKRTDPTIAEVYLVCPINEEDKHLYSPAIPLKEVEANYRLAIQSTPEARAHSLTLHRYSALKIAGLTASLELWKKKAKISYAHGITVGVFALIICGYFLNLLLSIPL